MLTWPSGLPTSPEFPKIFQEPFVARVPSGLGSPPAHLSPGWSGSPAPLGPGRHRAPVLSPGEGHRPLWRFLLVGDPRGPPRAPPTPVFFTLATCFSRPAVARGLGKGPQISWAGLAHEPSQPGSVQAGPALLSYSRTHCGVELGRRAHVGPAGQ